MKRKALDGALRKFFFKRPAEYIINSYHRMDRRLYDRSARTISIFDGIEAHQTSNWMIFVYNYRDLPPPYFNCIFDACRELAVNLLVVTNVALRRETKDYLSRRSQIFFQRAGVGRDFGAYKDAILLLRDRGITPKTLILCNDSVYYLPSEVRNLISKSLSHDGFLAISEVFGKSHHAQSFYISFGPDVIGSDAFQKYWDTYLPLSSRTHTIKKGELGLTRHLRSAGIMPRVLYSAHDIHKHLLEADEAKLRKLLALLPEAHSRFVLEKVASDVKRFGLRPQVSRASSSEYRQLLADAVVNEIAETNATSTGEFLFHATVGFPVVKRDIYFRELYRFSTLERIFEDLSIECSQEILSDLKLRGRITDLKVGKLRKKLYREGFF
ncbi:MAG: rhamnan synthesis F family protein [Hyphomicrobiales bacterium]